MSIKKHPILGDAPEAEEVTVILDGVPIKVEKGQMIAAALLELSLIHIWNTGRLWKACFMGSSGSSR